MRRTAGDARAQGEQRGVVPADSSLWAGGLGGLGGRTAWIGAVIGGAALGVGFVDHETDRPGWRTMIFTSLALLQVVQALATRSGVDSLRTIALRSDPVTLGDATLVVALRLAAVHTHSTASSTSNRWVPSTWRSASRSGSACRRWSRRPGPVAAQCLRERRSATEHVRRRSSERHEDRGPVIAPDDPTVDVPARRSPLRPQAVPCRGHDPCGGAWRIPNAPRDIDTHCFDE